jgi:hypothetical protein
MIGEALEGWGRGSRGELSDVCTSVDAVFAWLKTAPGKALFFGGIIFPRLFFDF